MEHGVIEVECLSGTCLQLLKKYHIHVHVPYVCTCVYRHTYITYIHMYCAVVHIPLCTQVLTKNGTGTRYQVYQV